MKFKFGAVLTGKMFGNYDDAWLMNESHVFHTSASTYSNPVCGAKLIDDDDEADEKEVSQVGDQEGEQGGDVVEAPLPPFDRSKGDNADRAGSASGLNGGSTKSCSKDASYSSCQSDLAQRWQDFCDNLAFSIKGKLFIMEFNFKRRLRAMRKYLDKKVPWMLQALASGHKHKHEHKCHDDCMTGMGSKSKRPNKQANGSLYKTDAGADYLMRSNIGKQEQAIGFGCFQFPEPKSAKTLSAQQECLLNRLERIKRDSQKLAQMQPELYQDRSHVDEIDYIDSDETGSSDGGASDSLHGAPQRSANQTAHYRKSLSYVLRAEPSKFYATGLCPSGSTMANPGSAKLTNSSAVAKAAAQTKLVRSSSSTSTTTNTTKASRGRWISRGGKHIRDTALAFTSSRKSCIVCYERAPNIVTLPCKHSDICSDCFIEIIFLAVKHSQYPLRCVLCRQKVERIRCSRRLLLNVIQEKRFKRC